MAPPHMETARMLDRDLKRGSTEMLIMAMVEDRARHGYEIGKLIEQRSNESCNFTSRRSTRCSIVWRNVA